MSDKSKTPPGGSGRVLIVGAAALALLAVAATVFWPRMSGEPDVVRGAALYAENCASCHGAALEGQENWKEQGPDGRFPAPPHDETGHTWHHADDVLARIIKEGSAAVVGGGYESDMMGFGDELDDSEIRDILAFIKSRWPARERAYQAEITRRQGG